MSKFVIKRILLIIPSVIVTSFIVFFLINLTPASPARAMLGDGATEEEVAQLNHDLGYDQPYMVRYFNLLWNSVHGDLGTSYYSSRPVVTEIVSRWPYTFTLAISTILLSFLLGVPLGILCAVKQYSAADRIASTVAMLFAATPNFWLASILVIIFAVNLNWFPANGISTFSSWVLPVAAATLIRMANFLRFSRSSMLDTIRQDYIRTARSKGAKESKVIFGHAFRNALIPLLTYTGVSLGYVMGGSIVIEKVFSVNGLGTMTLTAIYRKDIPQVMGCITVLAITFMFILLIIDIVCAFIDPRIKARYANSSVKKRKEVAKNEN